MATVNDGIDLSPLRRLPLWAVPRIMRLEGADSGMCLMIVGKTKSGEIMHVDCHVNNGENLYGILGPCINSLGGAIFNDEFGPSMYMDLIREKAIADSQGKTLAQHFSPEYLAAWNRLQELSPSIKF